MADGAYLVGEIHL